MCGGLAGWMDGPRAVLAGRYVFTRELPVYPGALPKKRDISRVKSTDSLLLLASGGSWFCLFCWFGYNSSTSPFAVFN